MIKDTNPDHYKVEGANFIEYMNDPKIRSFGNWMFANGFNSGVWASTNWISVKDRLPEQSGYVLTCYGDYHTINVFSYSKKHRAFNAHDCLPTAENNVDVTHWMPLPEPPEGVKQDA